MYLLKISLSLWLKCLDRINNRHRRHLATKVASVCRDLSVENQPRFNMSALIAIAIIIVIGIAIRLYEKNTNALCQSKKRLEGKTALVTGGTAGMGLEIAKDFARRGAKVIVACPFKEEGDNAKKEIVEQTGNAKVIFKLLDLASIDSVRKFAADIINTEERLDILINNAGIGNPKDFQTPDGMSFIMQVNYFGHFLLTLLLLPLLKKSGTKQEPSRIVNTSSVMHQMGAYDIKNINNSNHMFMFQIYAKSKICLVYFSRELTRRMKDSRVVVNSVDPGAVGTRIFDSLGSFYGSVLTWCCNNLYKTPWQGAQTALHVALDDRAGEVSGEFFKNCKQARAISWAYSRKIAAQVWEDSVRLVKLSDEEVAKCLE